MVYGLILYLDPQFRTFDVSISCCIHLPVWKGFNVDKMIRLGEFIWT